MSQKKMTMDKETFKVNNRIKKYKKQVAECEKIMKEQQKWFKSRKKLYPALIELAKNTDRETCIKEQSELFIYLIKELEITNKMASDLYDGAGRIIMETLFQSLEIDLASIGISKLRSKELKQIKQEIKRLKSKRETIRLEPKVKQTLKKIGEHIKKTEEMIEKEKEKEKEFMHYA